MQHKWSHLFIACTAHKLNLFTDSRDARPKYLFGINLNLIHPRVHKKTGPDTHTDGLSNDHIRLPFAEP